MTRRPKALAVATAFVLVAVMGEQVHARQNEFSHRVLVDQHAVGAAVYAPVYQERKYPGPGRYQKKSKKESRTAKRVLRVAGWDAPPMPVHLAHAPRQVLPHPSGCPARRFCGCGTAKYLGLGTPTRGGLAIAANWLKFPRAAPGPGTAAARRGHVFAIVQNLGHGRVLAYDPNSGRGRTHLHVRSLRGYTVVRPVAGLIRSARAI